MHTFPCHPECIGVKISEKSRLCAHCVRVKIECTHLKEKLRRRFGHLTTFTSSLHLVTLSNYHCWARWIFSHHCYLMTFLSLLRWITSSFTWWAPDDRQHCRLSICNYFGSLWQNLRRAVLSTRWHRHQTLHTSSQVQLELSFFTSIIVQWHFSVEYCSLNWYQLYNIFRLLILAN